MHLPTAPYLEQRRTWPASGRHILAHYDDHSVIVYQAYRPSIGQYAVEHQRFGGEFSYTRMSWVKPNFLWMMYRSGWGSKADQEVTLGLRLRRTFFDALLAQAVQSTYCEEHHPGREAWRQALAASAVRLQWDPDHTPSGAPLERRAIQLGLRGDVLDAFGTRELLEVIDLTDFVAEQRPFVAARDYAHLRTPVERVYLPADPEIGKRLGLADANSG